MSLISLSPFDLNSASFRRGVFANETELRQTCSFLMRDRHKRITNTDYFFADSGRAVDDYNLLFESLSESETGCYFVMDITDEVLVWYDGVHWLMQTPDSTVETYDSYEDAEQAADGYGMDYGVFHYHSTQEKDTDSCSEINTHYEYRCNCTGQAGIWKDSNNVPQFTKSVEASGCFCNTGYSLCAATNECMTTSDCNKITSCQNLVANVEKMVMSEDGLSCDCETGYKFDKSTNECIEVEEEEEENSIVQFIKDNSMLLIGLGVVLGVGSALR